MERISVRDASRYLRRVAAGESILITDRGRTVAVLSPPTRHQARYEGLVAGRGAGARRRRGSPRPVAGSTVPERLRPAAAQA
jgi:antitoxin (DNA-binding transcriptional repressor) of toxin-antitoxin stability system